MKIEKVKSRKYKDKQYHKFRMIIPNSIMEKVGFKEGDELNADAKKGELRLRRKLKDI